jgi:hypothetical protein
MTGGRKLRAMDLLRKRIIGTMRSVCNHCKTDSAFWEGVKMLWEGRGNTTDDPSNDTRVQQDILKFYYVTNYIDYQCCQYPTHRLSKIIPYIYM